MAMLIVDGEQWLLTRAWSWRLLHVCSTGSRTRRDWPSCGTARSASTASSTW